MVWTAAMAAVSRTKICVFWYFGTAIVIIIRMIAITISNSMRENPRRLLELNIRYLLLVYDGSTRLSVQRVLAGVGQPAAARQGRVFRPGKVHARRDP